MSSASPSPNSAVAAAPPPTSTSPPPPPSSAPPPPPPQSSSDPPSSTPLDSPPPEIATAPPPQPNSPPLNPPLVPPPQPDSPPPAASPPSLQTTPNETETPMASPQPTVSPPSPDNAPPPSTPPHLASAPPPATPPPPANAPPPSTPPPQPSSPPPTFSPPPPDPPPTSPPSTPPQSTNSPPAPPAPANSSPPPPSTSPPSNSPPPHPPPNTSPPPPSRNPPASSPPPPSNRPPQDSPPPSNRPPQDSPLPPPAAVPPRSPSTPPVPSQSPPPPNSPPRPLPPPSVGMSPPPPSTASSPPSISPPSLDTPGDTNSNDNVPQSSRPSSGGGLDTGVIIAIGMGSLFLGILGVVIWCCWKRVKKASGHNGGYIMPTSSSSPNSGASLLKVQVSSPNNGSGSGNGTMHSPREPGLGNSRSWFTYEELVDASNGFSAQNLLGEGGFGSVYKGTLADGTEVAIKQLRNGGGQGDREFRSEVEIISRIHHRHLVSLVGYCISGERRLLVLDYLPNNTLYFHLHGQPVLEWDTRVKIAIGAARGIAYLHEDCHPRIIHRDIKSSNILLDSNFEARVSDFGLAKLAMDANTHISTRVMGTFGYMAPEYASSGKLTEKSDVFSFGVVLLELITGRKPVDTSQPLGDESLVEWARPLLSHAVETDEFAVLADPRLAGNFVTGEMFRLIQAAAACVRHSSTKRPTMGQVVRAFDSMVTSDLTNGMRVGESEIFNSAEQSEEIRLFRRMAFGSREFSTDFFSQNSGSSQHNRQSGQRD